METSNVEIYAIKVSFESTCKAHILFSTETLTFFKNLTQTLVTKILFQLNNHHLKRTLLN